MKNDLVKKDYSQFVSINIADDDERGIPFTEDELRTRWINKNVPGVDTILIMIYSGYRISEFIDMKINLEERYLQGGIKTASSKNRIVPIHSAIYSMISAYNGKTWLNVSVGKYRSKIFYTLLDPLGNAVTESGIRHIPHDCRHTFS